MSKIGWASWFEKTPLTFQGNPSTHYGWSELLEYEPEKLDTWSGSTNGYMQCPAFVNYTSQIWVLRSWIDVDLIWDPKNNILSSSLPQLQHETMIRLHHGDFVPGTDRPIVAINCSYLFVADKSTYIEFLPPFNHDVSQMRLMPGSFNICGWQRPLVPTFEMLSNHLSIKRGQPLAYVRFKSENLKDVFKLEKIDKTPELEHLVKSCMSVKTYQRNISWQIAQSAWNSIRPSSFFKKSCPFKNIFKK
jgi:hypothetical protein